MLCKHVELLFYEQPHGNSLRTQKLDSTPLQLQFHLDPVHIRAYVLQLSISMPLYMELMRHLLLLLSSKDKAYPHVN